MRQKLAKSTISHQTMTPGTNRFVIKGINDNKVKLNTGLPNKGTLEAPYKHSSPKVKKMQCWAGAKKITSTEVPRVFKWHHRNVVSKGSTRVTNVYIDWQQGGSSGIPVHNKQECAGWEIDELPWGIWVLEPINQSISFYFAQYKERKNTTL